MFCGVDYMLEMSIVLGAEEMCLVVESTLVIMLWPTRYQVNYRAAGDQWSGVAKQLMVMYANKLRFS
jgi:hypothetical protein